MNYINTISKNKYIYSAKKVVASNKTTAEIRKKLSSKGFEMWNKNYRNVNIYKIIYYSNRRKIEGYVYQPKINKKLPVIIANRGGSKEYGMWERRKIFLRPLNYASWGYVVFASQYSGNGNSEGKDEYGGMDLQDVINLKKVINHHPLADKNKVAMVGGSRGGMMTYLALKEVNWIRAAVVFGAPVETQYKQRPRLKEWHKDMYNTNSLKEKAKRSPIIFVKKFNKCPLLIMHGQSDRRVPANHSLLMASELQKIEFPYKLIIFEGTDHGLKENNKMQFREIQVWLDRFLRIGEKMPNTKPHGL